MELHRLRLAPLDSPPLTADDPDATVWHGGERKPAVIAKRVGEWCWFRLGSLATYRFPLESPDLSVRCVADPHPGRNPATVVDWYYRGVVPLALQVYGLEAMHGTAIDTSRGAVVMCGFSHAGKTTLTYALSRRGHRVLADDGLVIDVGGEGDVPALRPIPFALMIREPSAEHFGTPVRAKVMLDDDEASAETVPRVPLAAVVVLNRVKDAELELRLEPATAAFTTLLQHSYAFTLADVERKSTMMAAYLRLANAVPVFTLTYPDGLERIDTVAAVFDDLLDSALGRHPSTDDDDEGPAASTQALSTNP